MTRWIIVTPPFEVIEPVTDEGQGPTFTECDVIEVDALTAREAIRIGVRAMLQMKHRATYCREQRMDGCNPFTGVRAIRG